MSNILNSIELGGVEHLLQDQRVDENMIGYELDDSGTGLTFTKGIGVGIVVSDLDYSEEEQLTGKRWIDGKPIYQNTYSIECVERLTLLPVDFSDVETIVESYLGTKQDHGDLVGGQYFRAENDGVRWWYSVSENGIRIEFGNIYPLRPMVVYVTAFYTKKSDTPSSPVKPAFPSSGDSKHEYSEEEKIVGTWIDGKPLYEKTVTIVQNNVGEIEHLHGIQDVDLIWASECFIVDNSKIVYNYSTFMSTQYNVTIYWVKKDKISLFVGTNRGSQLPFTCYITFHYTKTTD